MEICSKHSFLKFYALFLGRLEGGICSWKCEMGGVSVCFRDNLEKLLLKVLGNRVFSSFSSAFLFVPP